MTLNEMILDVKNRLDEDPDDTELDAVITVWLNEASLHVAVELEDLEDTDTQNILASQSDYDLPSDFLRLEQAIYNGVFLKPISREELKRYAGTANPVTSQTGTSEYCYLRANSIWLFPAPASALTSGLELWYYKKPAALSAEVECEHDSSLHHLLPLYATFLGFQKNLDTREAQTFKGYFEEGLMKAREFLSVGDRIELGQIYDPGD